MDCRIEIVDQADHREIRLVGRLTSAHVHDLLAASRGGRRVIRLNLSELVSVDSVGLEVLHDLQEAGAQLYELPAYIQLKLDSLSAKRGRPQG